MAADERNDTFYQTDERILLFGPLWLNRDKYRVMTAFHTEAIFSEDEFKTLYLLAANNELPLSFEHLYHRVWDKGDGRDRRDEALNGINSVMEQVNAVEPTMLWIAYQADKGYSFRLNEAYHDSAGGKR